jgi:cytochrome c-type biogenesis protein CcmH
VAVAAVVLIGGGAALYLRQGAPGYPDLPLADRLAAGDAARATRMSQAEAEAQVAAAGTQTLPEIDPDYAAMLEQLRRVVADRPDDLRGWELLSLHEARTGHYAAAARAQERVIALKGAEATPADLAALADRMVAAADGFVSPETEAVLRAILAADPTHPAGLYYTGLLYAQTDRPDIAFRLWRPLAEDGGSTPYGRLAAGLIGDAAFRAGIDYTPPAPRGPTAEDMAAAAEMDPAAREEMIRGMVGRLADRLATQGGPAADWARLISAYGVLGETEAARAVWTEAQTVFAGDTAALEALRAAAAGAGVAE